MGDAEQRVSRIMRRQLSLVTLDQALASGMSRWQVQRRVETGEWLRLHSRVFASADGSDIPERALLAACLGAGPAAAASHLSAAWLLGLVHRAPARPVITIPYRRSIRLTRVTIHRSLDLDQNRILERRGIRYTDPLRILTDVASELEADDLSMVVDAALSTKLVSTAGLQAEIARRSRSGRRGPALLADLLRARGMIGGPEPSVLEAQAMRLFRRWGIPVLGREVRVWSDGRYRIDFLIAEGLSVEVDGYAHHWSPEAKAYDDARRNRLRAAGLTVLVYDWRAIHQEPHRVVGEIQMALTRLSASA